MNQKLGSIILAACGLMFALLLGRIVGEGNYKIVLLLIAAIAGLSLAFLSSGLFWVITTASSTLAGTFPILGGSFTPFQLLMTLGVVKFLIEEITFKHTRIRRGPVLDRILIAGFMGVLILHAFHDRFGMRFLGSQVWGGRNYVNIFVGLAAYFVILSIPFEMRAWRKLPYFVLAVVTFDLLVALITTVFPSSIYTIYPFYSAVSRTGIEELITGNAGGTARLGSVGNFGITLVTLVLASTSLRGIIQKPGRSLVIVIAFAFTLLSSFRSSVFNALAVTAVAGLRDLKAGVLLLLPFIAIFLFGLSFINSDVARLPKGVQRSLSFLPGTWDTGMALDAEDSNEWRAEIWKIWREDFFPLHPWLGRGFGFPSEWAQQPVFLSRSAVNQGAVAVGNIHNGLFSAVDTFGLMGTLFFVIWNACLFIRVIRVPFNSRSSESFVLWFVGLGLASSIICYWIGAQTVGPFLMQEFVAASLFIRLREIFAEEKTPGPKPPTPAHPSTLRPETV